MQICAALLWSWAVPEFSFRLLSSPFPYKTIQSKLGMFLAFLSTELFKQEWYKLCGLSDNYFFLFHFSQGRIKSTEVFCGLTEQFVCCYCPSFLYWRVLAFCTEKMMMRVMKILESCRESFIILETASQEAASVYVTSNLQRKRLLCASGTESWNELCNS